MKDISMLAFVAAAGCEAIPLHPGAEKLRITHTEPFRCESLGDITGNEGNSLTSPLTTNDQLETGARHDLKNKAAALGGNIVALLTPRTGQSVSCGKLGGSTQQTNIRPSGNLYRCPL